MMAEQKGERRPGGKKPQGRKQNGEVKPVVALSSKSRDKGPRGSLRKLKHVWTSNGEFAAESYAEKHGLVADFNRRKATGSWAFTDTERGRNIIGPARPF